MVYLNQKSLANLVFSGSWRVIRFWEQALKVSRFYKEYMAGWQPLPRSDTFLAFLKAKISQNIQHVTLLFTLFTKSSVLFVNLCRCLFLPVACCLITRHIYATEKKNVNHDVSKVSPLQTKLSSSTGLSCFN